MAWRTPPRLLSRAAPEPAGAPFTDGLPVARGITRGESFQRKRRFGRSVDAKFSCAGGLIAGGLHQVADGGIPVAIRITEMPNFEAEQIFELFLARGNFLAREIRCELRQEWMTERVGADLMASREPVA